MKLKQRNKVWNFMDVCFCSIFFLSWHWGKSQELCQSRAWWSVRAIFDRHIMVTKCYTFPAESHLEYLKTAATPTAPHAQNFGWNDFFFWFSSKFAQPQILPEWNGPYLKCCWFWTKSFVFPDVLLSGVGKWRNLLCWNCKQKLNLASQPAPKWNFQNTQRSHYDQPHFCLWYTISKIYLWKWYLSIVHTQ